MHLKICFAEPMKMKKTISFVPSLIISWKHKHHTEVRFQPAISQKAKFDSHHKHKKADWDLHTQLISHSAIPVAMF